MFYALCRLKQTQVKDYFKVTENMELKPLPFEKQENCHRSWNFGKEKKDNIQNKGNDEENAIFVSRKKIKYDLDVNDTVRDYFIRPSLMRNKPVSH